MKVLEIRGKFMKTFTISACKFHSPKFKHWFRRWYDKGFIYDIQAKRFGEVEITIGFELTDPDEVRECVNSIAWRDNPDFMIGENYA